MPHSKKKQKLEDDAAVAADYDDNSSSFDRLGADALANIFGYLRPEDIMLARLNKKMREAAKTTIVPMTRFSVDSVRKFNALVTMSTALPNLQQIQIGYLGREHNYRDGEDRDEDRVAYDDESTTHDIEILSRFIKLRILELPIAPLNGRYPFLFNFPLLEQLKIHFSYCLKLDLEMLATGLPSLKELHCHDNKFLTGNLNSLRVLKDTLAIVHISLSPRVQGNFMDLADFPGLKELDLMGTSVTGDIRDIGECDFPTLESLTLPKGVYGGKGFELQRISDAPDIAMAVNSFKKQRPSLLMTNWRASLSEDSPDWYGLNVAFADYYSESGLPSPPLYVRLVAAGSRVGYRWETGDGEHPCEVNWLDPEPDRESSDYEKYIEQLRKIERQVVYRGFQQPPSEEAFNIRNM